MVMDELSCSQQSRNEGEALHGTALEGIDTWLLLECPDRWGRDLYLDSKLPEPVKAHLRHYQLDRPNVRVQLIRQKDSRTRSKIRFMAIYSGSERPGRTELELTDPEELCDLNFSELLEQRKEMLPLYLVCTHGQRDACCARYGPSMYRALEARVEARAWQSTHLGGHRFAPTVIAFPQGNMFGQLTAAQAESLIEGKEGDALPHFRGRTCYSRPVQTADWIIRKEEGLYVDAPLTLEASVQSSPTTWSVRFSSERKIYAAQVEARTEKSPSGLSCGAPAGMKWTRYRAIQLESEVR